VQAVLAAGAARDSLSYRALRTLVDLDPAVVSVLGFTRYRIEGDEGHDDDMTINVVDRGGIATAIRSRTEASSVLRGTKHRVVSEREVTVARGRSDGRTLVMVPEVKGIQVTGLTLLHVALRERVPFEVARQVLRGYRDRYAALQDQVTETEPVFRDELLADLDLADLLTQPVAALAEHWRS
jgi:glucosamine--fructose-6-phosphate aminotransferase (isomerizing)